MEYLDVVDEDGNPTGEVVSRQEAHARGIRHRTSHVWIVRKRNDAFEILLQQRSLNKESYPGFYDTSSAGHIPAGTEPLISALRELQEELGITANPRDLEYIGKFSVQYEKVFHDAIYRDNEITRVFVYKKMIDSEKLILQQSEVSGTKWFDLDEVIAEISRSRQRICAPVESLRLLKKFLMNTNIDFL